MRDAVNPALRADLSRRRADRLLRRVAARPSRGPRRVLLLDVAPAVAIAAFVCFVTPLALADDGAGRATLDAGGYALCVAAGAGFLVRRRLPLLTYAIALAATVAFVVLYDGGPIFVAALLAMLSVVVSRPASVWVPAALIGTVALIVAQVASEGMSFAVAVIAVVWVGAAVACGEIVRLRRVELAEIQARVELAERSQEGEALRRVAEERLRIAREVHDVVGHGLATISLQAGVAEHLLDSRPGEARKAVSAIRAVSKEALEELRAEIGALRNGSPAGDAPRRPTPGLDAVPRLVASMRDAGLAVQLDLRRNGDPLPDVVQAAGYRIVQEALTNVVRHAGPEAHARVTIRQGADGLEIAISDDGAGPSGLPEGNGIAGMRERAAVLGGRFEAGAPAEGGFRVWASLPAAPRP